MVPQSTLRRLFVNVASIAGTEDVECNVDDWIFRRFEIRTINVGGQRTRRRRISEQALLCDSLRLHGPELNMLL